VPPCRLRSHACSPTIAGGHVGSRALAHALSCVWQQAVRPMPCGLSKMALAAVAPTAQLDELQDQHSPQQRPCCRRWAAPLHRAACACTTVLPAAGRLPHEPRLGYAAPNRQARGKARSASRTSGVRGGGSSCKSSHLFKKNGPPRAPRSALRGGRHFHMSPPLAVRGRTWTSAVGLGLYHS
jgi:GAF domain-containing protein